MAIPELSKHGIAPDGATGSAGRIRGRPEGGPTAVRPGKGGGAGVRESDGSRGRPFNSRPDRSALRAGQPCGDRWAVRGGEIEPGWHTAGMAQAGGGTGAGGWGPARGQVG